MSEILSEKEPDEERTVRFWGTDPRSSNGVNPHDNAQPDLPVNFPYCLGDFEIRWSLQGWISTQDCVPASFTFDRRLTRTIARAVLTSGTIWQTPS